MPREERKARIFLSRLRPHVTPEEVQEYVVGLTGKTCDVEKVATRYATYASFVVTVDKRYEDVMLDPDEWEPEMLVRPFRGKLRTQAPHDDRRMGHQSRHGNTAFRDYSVRDSWAPQDPPNRRRGLADLRRHSTSRGGLGRGGRRAEPRDPSRDPSRDRRTSSGSSVESNVELSSEDASRSRESTTAVAEGSHGRNSVEDVSIVDQ